MDFSANVLLSISLVSRHLGAIDLVFDQVEELDSARQALCWLHEYNLDLAVEQTNGDTAWRRPSYSAIHRIASNIHGAQCRVTKFAALGLAKPALEQDVWMGTHKASERSVDRTVDLRHLAGD